jgi:hypothetical protein
MLSEREGGIYPLLAIKTSPILDLNAKALTSQRTPKSLTLP